MWYNYSLRACGLQEAMQNYHKVYIIMKMEDDLYHLSVTLIPHIHNRNVDYVFSFISLTSCHHLISKNTSPGNTIPTYIIFFYIPIYLLHGISRIIKRQHQRLPARRHTARWNNSLLFKDGALSMGWSVLLPRLCRRI